MDNYADFDANTTVFSSSKLFQLQHWSASILTTICRTYDGSIKLDVPGNELSLVTLVAYYAHLKYSNATVIMMTNIARP